MDIFFRNRWLEKLCNSDKEAKRELGAGQAEKLRSRLDDLDAAQNLAQIGQLQHHGCHELGGDRKGELAIRLKGGCRLVFIPSNEPLPKKPDGGLDWNGVTAITIVGILDYH